MSAEDMALQFADSMMWLEDQCEERVVSGVDLSRLQFFRLLVCVIATRQWSAPPGQVCSTTVENIAAGLKLLVDSDASDMSGSLTVEELTDVFATARRLMYAPQRPAPSARDYGELVCFGLLNPGPEAHVNPFSTFMAGKTVIELSGSDMLIDILDDVV